MKVFWVTLTMNQGPSKARAQSWHPSPFELAPTETGLKCVRKDFSNMFDQDWTLGWRKNIFGWRINTRRYLQKPAKLNNGSRSLKHLTEKIFPYVGWFTQKRRVVSPKGSWPTVNLPTHKCRTNLNWQTHLISIRGSSPTEVIPSLSFAPRLVNQQWPDSIVKVLRALLQFKPSEWLRTVMWPKSANCSCVE